MTYACRDCDTTFTAPTDTDTVRCPGCGDMAERQPAASPLPDQTLRDRIAEAVQHGPTWMLPRSLAEEVADAVLAVLPPPADRVAVLREAAEDLATAFGDPMVKHIGAIAASHLRRRARELEGREAVEEQPETPLEKRFRYSERRNDELRAECKRRGKTVLEYAEKIERLEKQLDEVRAQLGAEILRAGQAEAALERIRVVVRRLVNHAIGFQDVLDDSDRDPWSRTVRADIAEVRRLAAEAQPELEADPQPVSEEFLEHLATAKVREDDGAEAPQADTETRVPAEDPARVDRLRPEFTEHASIEAIDVQLRRARAQERRWHLRTEWLIGLRADRVAQKERGEWPDAAPAAAGPGRAADTQDDEEGVGPRTVCVCGHTRAEHIRVSGPFGKNRLLCDVCDPDSAENLTCKEFEAL